MSPLAGFSATFPIKIVAGVLVSEAVIEGKEVSVIFDSGSPGLVLNSKYYTAKHEMDLCPCTGINGNFECQTYKVSHWSWMEVENKQTTAILSDLSFLESALHKEIHALVGLSVLADYYVSIDFDLMSVTLSKKMDVDKKELMYFDYVDQLPVITCEVNGEKKTLGLDTGSEINYIFSIAPREKKVLMTHATPVMVIGTENKQDLKYSTTMELNIDDQEYNSNFIIDSDLTGNFHHAGFDGFLGLEFLDQFNITIHPGKQILMLTPRAQPGSTMLASALSMQ